MSFDSVNIFIVECQIIIQAASNRLLSKSISQSVIYAVDQHEDETGSSEQCNATTNRLEVRVNIVFVCVKLLHGIGRRFWQLFSWQFVMT